MDQVEMAQKMRLAVFASHGGSNLQSLIEACAADRINGEIAIVVSNNRKAYALERALKHGIETLVASEKAFDSPEAFAADLINQLVSRQIDLVCLAGYMKKIPNELLRKFRHRVINIHPALLPKYGGQGMYGIHVHKAVIAAGEKETGVSIHLVDEVYDHGAIIAQRRVPVSPDDTPETLQQRVLEIEHQLYPETIARIASGELRLE
jgi:phosphoribosylglycinamide formyltransferase-1